MDDGVITPLVGRNCEDDASCGEGLTCFRSGANDFFGAGPAGGYCSLQCVDESECAAIDPASTCDSGLCLRACRSQDPTSAQENKCLGRRDVACQSEAYLGLASFTGARQPGLCLPQCGSDEDCDGRFCDLARGLCTSAQPTGAEVGAACETDDDCAGRRCIADGPNARLCTAPCVFGQPVGCGQGITANPRSKACFRPVVTGFASSEGLGDVGLCIEACDVDSDCLQVASGFVCVADPVVSRFGRAGICRGPRPTDAGADSGDAGDASSVVGDASSVAGDAAIDASN